MSMSIPFFFCAICAGTAASSATQPTTRIRSLRSLLCDATHTCARSMCVQNGKLRLLYEAAPMSFIVEQAGGKASTGYERIMDLHPSK